MAKTKKVKANAEPFTGNLEELIVQALIEKKGEDIVTINLKKINHVFFDYFIICTGNSKPHVETLTDFIIETTKKEAGIRPTFIEGTANGDWVLVDYFNIIVHIFQPEARQFYDLERLWNDAEITHY